MSALGFTSAAHAVDIVGTQVTLGWSAAPGPVSGYYVIVARDAGQASVESVTVGTTKTLTGTVGQTLVVQVAAFAQDGVAGPVSAPSSPIKFVASSGGGSTPPPDGGSGTTPPPPPPPPTDGLIGVTRDFDGDGDSDLVVATGSSVKIWAMDVGKVASELALPAAPSGARVVGTGDYDGNGTADLVWENSQTGALTLWRLNAGVVLATGALDRSSLPAVEEWQVGGSGDFDGDGADDLMLFSRVKGEVEVWGFSGTSVAVRTRIAGHKGAWSVVAVDDIDGDGKAEVVWLDELKRNLELRDPAASAPVVIGTLAPGFRGRGGVDSVGDGAELVISDTATGAVQGFALDDAGILGSTNLPNATGLGRYAGAGDYDGNGGEDIAWSDVFDGAVTLWLATTGAPNAVIVNRVLPAGGQVVSGNTTSDQGTFRKRFCSGDLDGNGDVNANDFRAFRSCLGKQRSGTTCDVADMDSDGWVTKVDSEIFKLRFNDVACEAW